MAEVRPIPFNEMAHQWAVFQSIRTIHQVLPHEVFSEGECAYRNIGNHLEAGHISYGRTNRAPDARHIDARMVLGKIAFEARDREFEVLPEELKQREIEPRLVLVRSHCHAR